MPSILSEIKVLELVAVMPKIQIALNCSKTKLIDDSG
jgi:hypothetical protein